MTTIIMLAMHGMPPSDFPPHELAELFGLHARLEHGAGSEHAAVERRHAELEARMRAWPRTAQNDPFHAGSLALAHELARVTQYPVIVGFNEFCGPSLDGAFDRALEQGADKVIVVTPMVTRGGEHSEVDIPSAIQRARARFSHLAIVYAWPFPTECVAEFLAAQMEHFLEETDHAAYQQFVGAR
jgi:sirohydrochlorin cobaltochelatase